MEFLDGLVALLERVAAYLVISKSSSSYMQLLESLRAVGSFRC